MLHATDHSWAAILSDEGRAASGPYRSRAPDGAAEARGRMYASIQYLRALAVVSVLVLHSHSVLPVPVARVPLLSEFGWVGVRLFFVISGFIVADRIGHCADLRDYLIRRYVRVFPLYALATAIALGAWLWTNTLPFTLGHTDSGLPFDPVWHAYLVQSLFIVPQDAWPVLAVGWSLEFELAFYAAFGVTTFLAGGSQARLLLAALALAGALGLVPGSHFAHTFMVYFLAGCLCRDVHRRWHRRWPGRTTGAAWATFAAATPLWVLHLHGLVALGEVGFVVVSAVSFAALILIGLAQEDRLPRLPVHRAVMAVGDASFAIYLVHWLVFFMLKPLLAGAALDPETAEAARWGIVSAAVLVSMIVHRRTETPLNRAVADRLRRPAGAAPARA